MVKQIVTISTHELGQFDIAIENPQIEPLAEQSLSDFQYRALSQVVSSRLETQAENADFLAVGCLNHVNRPVDVYPITR